jgi:carbohydrate-binding DOMON domain-containing protein
VSLLDVELEGLEKVKDMEVVGDDLIGSTSRVLMRSVRVDTDWAFDVGLLILPDWVTDGGVG